MMPEIPVGEAPEGWFTATLIAIAIIVPLVFWLPGIRDGLPSAAKFDRVLPDRVARESAALVISNERTRFESILADKGYVNYDSYNQLLRQEKGELISDAEGGAYELTRRHLTYLKRIVFGSLFGDETKTITALRMMNPSTLNFNPHWFLYGGAYLYLAAIFLKLAQIAGYIQTGSITFFLLNLENITRIFLVVKFVNLVAAFFGTIFFGLLARRLVRDSALVGLLAALLFASAPIYTFFAHFCKPYLVGQAYGVAALWFYVCWLEGRSRRWFIAAAIFWGLAVGSNYVFAANLMPHVILYGFYRFKARSRTELFVAGARDLVVFSLIAIVTFFIVNPYWLFSLGEVKNELFVQQPPKLDRFDIANYLYFYLRPFFTIGIPATITAYFVVITGLVRRERIAVISLVSLIVFGFALSSLWNTRPPALIGVNVAGTSDHYDGFGVHLWLLLAVTVAVERLGIRRPAGIALAVIVLASNFAYSGYSIAQLAGLDEKFMDAGSWVEANVPKDEIVMSAPFFESTLSNEDKRLLAPNSPLPLFSLLRYRLVFPEYRSDTEENFPSWVVTRNLYLESVPRFGENYLRAYESQSEHQLIETIFYRGNFDRDPIYIYRRKQR